MKNLGLIDLDALSPEAIAKLTPRSAARAVVQDEEGYIALLFVANDTYYKLPGGGIEPGEDTLTALKRECLEEIGCAIEVTGEVGQIKEYRYDLNQDSFCYIAKIIGAKGEPTFTTSEKDDGFAIFWVTPEMAHKLLSEAKPTRKTGRFIQIRDMTLLREAYPYAPFTEANVDT